MLRFHPSKRLLAAAGALGVCLVLSVSGLCCAAAAKREYRTLSTQTSESLRQLSLRLAEMEENAANVSAREYLLLACEGKIGVYNVDATLLYEILDVNVRTLPAADQAMLAEGIIVCGETALRALTEDYTS